jgi:hypothetical protein
VGFSNQTIRNIAFTSIGGNGLRVRLSNVFGRSPLRVGRVTVGLALVGARLARSSVRRVSFHGRASVVIPEGREVVSDHVPMPVRAQQNLAISLYLPASTGPATYHQAAWQTNYMASGEHALDGVQVRMGRATGHSGQMTMRLTPGTYTSCSATSLAITPPGSTSDSPSLSSEVLPDAVRAVPPGAGRARARARPDRREAAGATVAARARGCAAR